MSMVHCCPVCCERFDRLSRKPIECLHCHLSSCHTCAKEWILSTQDDPSCMHCKKVWNFEFLYMNMTRSFLSKEYRLHR